MPNISQKNHLLYKIYYSCENNNKDILVYLGRTNQNLQTRLRGHFFCKPMHRKINIFQVSKIEYAECKTIADMYVYEVYYINKFHPPLNIDDNSFYDNLTISIKELEWKIFDCKLMDKWKDEINKDPKKKSTIDKLSKRNFGGLSKVRKLLKEENKNELC